MPRNSTSTPKIKTWFVCPEPKCEYEYHEYEPGLPGKCPRCDKILKAQMSKQ